MTDRQNELCAMIHRQLRRPRPPDTKALYGRAVRIDPGIRALDPRQFNARHVLPVRREIEREDRLRPEQQRAILILVKRRLVQDPTVSKEALYQEAIEKMPLVEVLAPAQFHERYALPVRRKLPNQDSSQDEDVQAASLVQDSQHGLTTRHEIRKIFLDFARMFEGAADRAEVVRVVGNIDSPKWTGCWQSCGQMRSPIS